MFSLPAKYLSIVVLLLAVPLMADQFKVEKDLAKPVLVFAAGRDHVKGHTDGQIDELATGKDMYQCYREPVTVRTNSGRIVVLCHAGNRIAWPERSGQDFTVTYSDDGGKSWASPILAAEDGKYSLQSHGLVYDALKDRFICLYTVYRWDYSIVKGRGAQASAPAIKQQVDAGRDLQRQYMITSDDQGETWSKPVDITSMVAVEGSNGHFGSSEGRQLTLGGKAGRLILPGGTRHGDGMGHVTEKVLHVWISDDHGKTWRASRPLMDADKTGEFSMEARVTEMQDGTLLYNLRTRSKGRLLATSSDSGDTWSPLKPAGQLQASPCNGSMLTIRDANGKLTETLLCSLPTPGGRSQGVVYVSFDSGKTWPKRNDIVPGFFAYSALVQIDDKNIGLFYEDDHYRNIRFINLPIRLLTRSLR